MHACALANVPYAEVKRSLEGHLPVIGIVPVGATEAHGPHLPLGTDVIISEAFAYAAAHRLRTEGRVVPWVLPSLAYSPAEYAASFCGTLSIRAATLGLLLDDIARSLGSQGFRCLAFANSHFDPANVQVLRQSAARITATGLPVAYPDATRRDLAAQLGEEFQSGDCHGGQFEGSIVLASHPELVDHAAMHKAAPVRAGLLDAMRGGGVVDFQNVGMTQAYCGRPAEASSDEGKRSIDVLADALCRSVYAAVFSTDS